jgi:hypothetical protein
MTLGDRPAPNLNEPPTNQQSPDSGQPIPATNDLTNYRQQQNEHGDPVDQGKPEPDLWSNPSLGRYQSWIALGATVLALPLVAAAGHAYNQARIAQHDLESVEIAAVHRSAGDYDACINQAQSGAANAVIADSLQNLMQSCQSAQQDRLASDQLVLAQSLVDSGKLKEAISIATRIEPSTQAYAESQQLINYSSQRLLEMAHTFYDRGQLDAASNMVAVIPATSNLKGKALSQLALWQQEQQQNELALQEANQELSKGNWQAAIASARQVTQSPHWQKQAQAIINKAQANLVAVNQPALNAPAPRSNPPSYVHQPAIAIARQRPPTMSHYPAIIHRQQPPITIHRHGIAHPHLYITHRQWYLSPAMTLHHHRGQIRSLLWVAIASLDRNLGSDIWPSFKFFVTAGLLMPDSIAKTYRR